MAGGFGLWPFYVASAQIKPLPKQRKPDKLEEQATHLIHTKGSPMNNRQKRVVTLARQVEPAQPADAPGPGRGHKVKPKNLKMQGNGSAYLMRRIKRDHPDILARCLDGEFVSVRQAAIAAGIIKRKEKRNGKKTREQ